MVVSGGTPGTISGSGTTGTLPYFDSSTSLANSPITRTNSTTVSVPSLRLGTIGTTTGQLLLLNSANANSVTLKAGASAASRIYTWPTDFGAAGTVLKDAAGNGTLSWDTAGISNSAPSGTVPVTADASGNLATSPITYAGGEAAINGGVGNDGGASFTAGRVYLRGSSASQIDTGGGVVALGDTDRVNNSTTVVITDGDQKIQINAGLNITNTAPSIPNVTSLFGVGSTGAEFQISDNGGGGIFGTITRYGGTSPTNGQLLIGRTSDSSLQINTLTAGSGISVTNGAGSITIAQDGTTPKKATVALTAQSASIGATNLQVDGGVAPAGLYRLSYYLVTTTAGTSGTVSATFGWSDIAAARTAGTGNITFGTLASPASGTVIIQANGVANITYLTTVTAAVGSPVYALNITLERLQ